LQSAANTWIVTDANCYGTISSLKTLLPPQNLWVVGIIILQEL